MRAPWFLLLICSLSCAYTTGCMTVWNEEQGTTSRRLGFKPSDPRLEHAEEGSAAHAQKQRSSHNRDDEAEGPLESEDDSFPATRSPLIDESREVSDSAPRRLGSASADERVSYKAEPDEVTPPEQMAEAAGTLKQTEQEQALSEVVAELEKIGELDPETKRQLIADLRETKPALWQPMISIYRLALSSRKRTEARESAPPAVQSLASDDSEDYSEASMYNSPAETQVAIKKTPAPAAAMPAQPEPSPLPAKTASLRHSPLHTEQQLEPAESKIRPTEYVQEELVEDQLVAEIEEPRHLKVRPNRLRPAVMESAETLAPRRVSQTRSRPKQYAVETVSAEEEIADWQAYLEESILLLEEGLPKSARTVDEVRQQAELRLLYLAGGDREAALRPIEGISTTQQEFWSETIFALATYLDAESLPDGPRRAAEARRHLEAAVLKLGELSTLSVRNIAFCSKVNSYGIYETYPKDEFAPGQQVLLYAELENFKCENTPTGFVTAVRSSYQIFDSRGVRVESHDFATTEETCRNRRRDFFMRYFIDLPTRIYDGEYTLKLTIEDLKGQTSGEAIIPFTIKEKQ